MCVLFVTIIVGRSKLAWDFAVTIHIINLIITWCYVGKFPTSMLWWMLQVVSAFLLVTLSTYSTRWKELRVTFFTNMLETRQPETVELEDMNRPSWADSMTLLLTWRRQKMYMCMNSNALKSWYSTLCSSTMPQKLLRVPQSSTFLIWGYCCSGNTPTISFNCIREITPKKECGFQKMY